MADIANKPVLAFLLLFASSLAALGQASPRQCGYDRWPVKILSDKDREKVNFTLVETTVASLTSIPIHEVPYPRDKRISPEEFKVYKLKAKLIEVRSEKDSDLHLIIADLDKPNTRMIAEIPAPQCAEGTGREEDYRRARDELTRIPIGSIVEISGVGFFDFLHDATGGAKNGIELHPVLTIKLIRN
jgi:hypothetical protein